MKNRIINLFIGFILIIGVKMEMTVIAQTKSSKNENQKISATKVGDETVPVWNTTTVDPASNAMFYKGDWREAFQNRDKLPDSAKTRVWWWLLNSNIDKEAITRDLEEMARIGIGGLNMIDAGGAARPNWSVEVPVGPPFGSDKWKQLFLHALNEAHRLNIEISLNIQSGWNLGGPDVTPNEAAWTLESTTTTVDSDGNTPIKLALPQPTTRYQFYRDLAVFAIPVSNDSFNNAKIKICQTPNASPSLDRMIDGKTDTFWVSEVAVPVTLDFYFDHKVSIEGVLIRPRNNYGPKTIELYSVDNENNNNDKNNNDKNNNNKKNYDKKNYDKKNYGANLLAKVNLKPTEEKMISFPSLETTQMRLVIIDSYDPRFPEQPRNAQISELNWIGPEFHLNRSGIDQLAGKTASRELGSSAPRSEFLLDDSPSVPGEVDVQLNDIVDLSSFFIPIKDSSITSAVAKEGKQMEGHLNWKAPQGKWSIIRMGYTVGALATVSTCTPGSGGLALNPLDPVSFNRYWNDNIEPLIKLAGNHVGTTWKYCHTDSWELGGVNWSRNFREEFKRRRGYDLWKWLPVIAGQIVNSRDESNRFLADLRKTIADCIAANHYDQMLIRAREHGMYIHPESGGPHGAPIDGLMNIGHSEIPMMEFWCKSKTHRVRVEDRHFVKQGSSAANIYNRHLVQAEGFTTVGPHWEETFWDNMRPTLDYAATEGLNRFVWHQFTCSPKSAGLPGQVYFAGTHCNPKTLWWSYGRAFFDYLNRSQFLLQQGIATADILVYYGDWIPNFVRGKKDDPANVLPGYDFDVVNEEALLEFAKVKENKIVFPSGAEYQLLVLPSRENISLPVLKKLEELVQNGARISGPKPTRMTGLNHGRIDDSEVKKIADSMWYSESGKTNDSTIESGVHSFKKGGKVFWGMPTRKILQNLDVVPALEIQFKDPSPIPVVVENAHSDGKIRHIGDPIAWIQRKTSDGKSIYLLSNQANVPILFTATFREDNIGNGNVLRMPELWNAVSGEIRPAFIQKRIPAFNCRTDVYRTAIELKLEPFEGIYVVFENPDTSVINRNDPISDHKDQKNYREWKTVCPIQGSWQVDFYRPEKPDNIAFSKRFDELIDWSRSQDENVKYFSGRAVYRISFPWSSTTEKPIYLNLGMLREISRIRLNDKDLGVCWTFPFRIDISSALQYGNNKLEISVSNFWPNALIGDGKKVPEQRVYKTNVIKFNKNESLKPSGLWGPIILEQTK